MQEIDSTLVPSPSQPDLLPDSEPRRRTLLRRFIAAYYLLLALLLLALIPPLISVNRYQRRIATSIGQSLGRPVRLSSVSLNLLPLPGFTIEELVVGEDPAFGSEPIIRAQSVRATLRLASLWRRQVEFSSISFTDPSVNLVHLPNGRWNLQSILVQAAHIQAAPTDQKTAGPAPRFPYIEATGARVNLKLGQEKLPISLTEAEFALWLPDPQQWRLRIEAHPARTDTNATDTGTLIVEGTLGHAASLTEVPIHLDAEWRTAPLGAVSQVLLGHDAGIRGDMALTAHAYGTVGKSALTARLHLNAPRRDDFVPQNAVAIDLQCQATATGSFHTFNDLQCALPAPATSQSLVLLSTIPDLRDLSSATAKLGTPRLPLGSLADWLHVLSNRIPADLKTQGTLTGSVESEPGLAQAPSRWDTCLHGSFQLSGLTIASPQTGLAPLAIGDLAFQASKPVLRRTSHTRANPSRIARPADPSALAAAGFFLAPTTIDLGGKEPATIEGRIDSAGYTLHLSGLTVLSQLLALGKAIPQFGDGLKEALPANRAAGPVRIDLTATRRWNGPQQWQDTTTHPTPTPRPRHASQ